ncbi:monosaccharide transporter [Dimargaris cristalligena]|uniref:Monosaccharide transporter n=1 Tax=Dimargaris cristalligena TaxID=215637 RepID=A0A4Q0A2N4_9FUNG|nr:monosaccharide transporter [Dimargaris cristalligena]|eukprot:RKP40375.1 monosaccharide transporter [Dimargaris cristalligena]
MDSRESKVTSFILFSTIVASLASFNVGWNTGVTNIPEETIRKCVNNGGEGIPPTLCVTNSITWGASVAMFAIGGLIGGLTAGMVANRFGRRLVLMFNNIFFTLGGIVLAISPNVAVFAFGRILTGIGCGVSSVVVSTFMGEISSNRNRGALGSMLQLTLNIGILATQCIGLGLDNVPGWRILLALTAVPALAQVLLLFGCVETPRWLASKGRYEDARRSLEKLRSGYDIEQEYDEIVRAQRPDSTESAEAAGKKMGDVEHATHSFGATTTYSVWDLVTGRAGPVLRRHLFISIFLHMAQQLTGINGVIFYSTSTFQSAFGDSAKYVTIGAVGSLGVLVTSASLMLVDRLGRKKLLFLSAAGMALSSTLLVIGTVTKTDPLVLAAVMLFITFFGIGLGPIPWLIVSELFPTNAVGAASSVAIGANYLCNFAIAMLFPYIASALGSYGFVPYAIVGVVCAVIILMFVPETKGKSLEEITRGH